MWRQILFTCAGILLYLYVKLIDSRPNKTKYNFKFLLYYSYAFIVTAFLCPYVLIKGRTIQNSTIMSKLLRPMATFYGMQWKVENEEYLALDGSAVIVSNHQMSFDLLGMFHIWHKIKNVTAIAKKELLYFGHVGLVTYFSGIIFVDRKNTKKDYQVLEDTIETIKKHQIKVWVFPEGKRNKAKNVKLLPFKKGAFVIAICTQSPIIPVVYSPYYFADEKKRIFYNGGKVIMRCLPPIPTKGLTLDDLPELQERLHKLILNTYEELTKEVLNELPPDYPLLNKDQR